MNTEIAQNGEEIQELVSKNLTQVVKTLSQVIAEISQQLRE